MGAKMPPWVDLRTDPGRENQLKAGILRATNIPVRAKRGEAFDNVDIVELDRISLLVWLRSRGGDNPWAENLVLILLGHVSPNI